MNLFHLCSLIEESTQFRDVIRKLTEIEPARVSLRLAEQAYGYLIAAIAGTLSKPCVIITAHPETAKRRMDQYRLWLKPEFSPYLFPEIDLLNSMVNADPVINSDRLKILSMLSGKAHGRNDTSPIPVVVASALALAGKCISKKELASGTLRIQKGAHVEQSHLIDALRDTGYKYEQVVEIPGTFVKRGGLVDVFPSGCECPIRIEFFGDEIESVREFDARTQRSLMQLEKLEIHPATEKLSRASMSSLLEYLPGDAILLLDDPLQIEAELVKIEEEIAGLVSMEHDAVSSGSIYDFFSWREIKSMIGKVEHLIELNTWEGQEGMLAGQIKLPLLPAMGFAGRFPAFIESLPDFRKQYKRVMIISQQAERVREMLAEHGMEIYPSSSLADLPADGSLTLIQGPVEGGWQFGNQLILFTDNELFGLFKQRRSIKPRPIRHRHFLDDIGIGNLVVHVEHGIGRFAGITRKVSSGTEKEYLVLEYAGGDTLYVPVEQVDRVSAYIGGGERTPSLNRLGTYEWSRARQKVKDSVKNIAGELIEVYARREAGGGIAFSSDTLWQKELEASFPYVETPDQLEALKLIKEDMESSKPMDRLLCGDVGYGKTEVAVRAAFKAVMEGKQVAMLVPTTVLVQQHVNTFNERLGTYPVKVGVLSRFCSSGEQSRVIRALREGQIDICIGTHRILQKDVQFKDLGLVIIDEEQRFGVVHKEYFKKMRQSVDILTLSATPIPRTMHMALSGIRDMSTIETPPESRLPINTFVGEFNNRVVREAIIREIERDGQVFFVHNRIHSIGALAHKIKELVPEAKIAVAHGRLDESDLERVMADFIQGKIHVLITTTIIESGLDMPNVNTLIVDSADKLGLTQLYQLRGRVGRGANTAYAYFLFDSVRSLTDQASERLKTIAQATELGAGFAIAMKDLEIRGAGNLLGVEQSGNIAAVGFNYYCQMLAEAVEELKEQRYGRSVGKKEEMVVPVNLKLNAYIAREYIEDTSIKFNIYQRLAECRSISVLGEIEEELKDRFGDMPEEVANLLYIVEIKLLAAASGAESVSTDGNYVILSFKEGLMPDVNIVGQGLLKSVIFGNRQIRINVTEIGERWKEILRQMLQNASGNACGGNIGLY